MAAMASTSAGVLLHRSRDGRLQVLLGHMGGPFYARKQARAWTVPKGEYGPDEEPVAAARREWVEELGLPAPSGEWLPLGEVRQSGGKQVSVWAVEGDLDPATITPGTFELEWPPRSGRRQEFPELDRVAWFDVAEVGDRIVTAQAAFLERLAERLA